MCENRATGLSRLKISELVWRSCLSFGWKHFDAMGMRPGIVFLWGSATIGA